MKGRRAGGWLTAALTVVAVGCGSASGQVGSAGVPPPGLATSLVTASGAWAVADLGGAAADHNNFWQVFTRSAAGAKWQLVTPPGMASNGGLVMAAPGGRALPVAFRPSQQIRFSPSATTSDSGGNWSAGLVDASLADVPDALALAPRAGRLIALTADAVEMSRPGGAAWAKLADRQSLAASAPGRRCGLRMLTAVAFSPAGMPLAAGSCAHPGITGVFAFANGTWRAAGPRLPGALAGQPVTVLRLTIEGNRETSLLSAGAGADAVLFAAWSDGVGRWTLSPPLRLRGAVARSAAFGSGGNVGLVTSTGGGETITGPGAVWRRLPRLPRAAQTLALGPGPVQVLAADQSTLTVWQINRAGADWAAVQRLQVPVPYGSSS